MNFCTKPALYHPSFPFPAITNLHNISIITVLWASRGQYNHITWVHNLIFIHSENSCSWSSFWDVLNCSQKHFRRSMSGEWLLVVWVIRVKLLGHPWFDIVVYGTINTGIRLSLSENHLNQRKTPLSLYLIKISAWEHWFS